MRLIALALVLFPLTIHARTIHSSYELVNPDLNTLNTVRTFFDAEGRRGNTYEVIVSESEAKLLLALAPQARLVERDTAAANQARLRAFSQNNFMARAGYHSFTEVQAWMQNTAKMHPEMAEVDQYGVSAEKRPLLALHVKTNVSAGKPVLMITAATHGDELITTEVLLQLVDELFANYGKNARLTQILDRHDIYFVPVLNPDGFTSTDRYDGDVDPNRSYPWPSHEDAKPSPSIAGIIHLFETIKPAGTLDYHAYSELVMYPWGYTEDQVPEPTRSQFNALAKSMSEENHYTYGNIADTIYIAPGSSADYYYWKMGSTAFAIEIGQSKIPNPSEIPAYVTSQEESLWRFIESF